MGTGTEHGRRTTAHEAAYSKGASSSCTEGEAIEKNTTWLRVCSVYATCDKAMPICGAAACIGDRLEFFGHSGINALGHTLQRRDNVLTDESDAYSIPLEQSRRHDAF